MRRSILLAIFAGLWGVAFEALVVGHDPGLGWLFLTVTVWLSCQALSRRLERPAPLWLQLLWLVPFSFAASLSWYDASAVATFGPALTCLGLLTCATLTLAAERDPLLLGQAPGRGVVLLVAGPTRAPGALYELADWRQQHWETAGRVLWGLLAALPVLAVFGMLFAAADEMFSRLLAQSADSLSGQLGWPLVRVSLLCLTALGFLRAAIAQVSPAPRERVWHSLDPLSLGVVVLLVNLLFLSFLMVQARYLFGGETSLPIWEYARRGFFELATCTALVFLLVLAVYRVSDPQGVPRLLAGLLVLQTSGVAASALYRMALYSSVYGLSVLRIYATLGIVAMGLGLGLLGLAFRREWRSREVNPLWLSSRLALAGMVFLAGVAWLDVEGTVAQYNLARWSQGGKDVDLAYLGTLSCDAAPALAQYLREGHTDLGVAVALNTIKGRQETRSCSWQSWNVSRGRLVGLQGVGEVSSPDSRRALTIGQKPVTRLTLSGGAPYAELVMAFHGFELGGDPVGLHQAAWLRVWSLT